MKPLENMTLYMLLGALFVAIIGLIERMLRVAGVVV